MPELPEVETVRRGLAPAMEGQVIARAEVNRPDLRWPFPERMAERLTGQRVGGNFRSEVARKHKPRKKRNVSFSSNRAMARSVHKMHR